MKPIVGLAFMPEADFCQAAFPLFEEGVVEALEWSFDTCWRAPHRIAPFEELLKEYSNSNRLLGHGVTYSLLSADKEAHHDLWVQSLKAELTKYSYRHITEHFGWMIGGNFHEGTPLPLPLTEETFELGLDRLRRISSAIDLPLGLENLAFAYHAEDVKSQCKFLTKLLCAINGFLILDLHNLYCQVENFDLPFEELLPLYPLELVREIHLSGGSWSETSLSSKGRVRRDTHDDALPEELFNYLEEALAVCPNLEVVIIERLGNTLKLESEQERFRNDFYRVREVVCR